MWPNFDLVSDQIIEYIDQSESEKDGATLIQVIKLVSEKAEDEAALGEKCVRLCRKVAERVSPNIQDETIRGAGGQPNIGGTLFRKYLYRDDFERGWSAKEAAARTARKTRDNKASGAVVQAKSSVAVSDEHYAAAKAKRQGLGLIQFIGELYKL